MNIMQLSELKLLLALNNNTRLLHSEEDIFISSEDVILHYVSNVIYPLAFERDFDWLKPLLITDVSFVILHYTAFITNERFIAAEPFMKNCTDHWARQYKSEYLYDSK